MPGCINNDSLIKPFHLERNRTALTRRETVTVLKECVITFTFPTINAQPLVEYVYRKGTRIIQQQQRLIQWLDVVLFTSSDVGNPQAGRVMKMSQFAAVLERWNVQIRKENHFLSVYASMASPAPNAEVI